MAVEITMPQLSDTMTQGVLVKWHKKEGDRISAGEKVADIETDKAVMELEAFDDGVLAAIWVQDGQTIKVGGVLGMIATGSENAAEVKQKAGKVAGAKPDAVQAASSPSTKPSAEAAQRAAPPAKSTFEYDIVVIGGGPAGYAAAIRAGQLKKRVLCIEKENLGGTCLNWGCIPTKALLEDGAFVRRLRTEAADHGITITGFQVDFAKIIARSRKIADQLSKGIAHLFKKYNVQKESGTGQVLSPHKVRLSGGAPRDITAEHIILATGAVAASIPGVEFDGKLIISSREAMNLPRQPQRLAIIGAGAIGCEFADFYNALGTQVTIVEMLGQLLPNEDPDVSRVLDKAFVSRGIDVRVGTKTDKVEKTAKGVKLTLSGGKAGVVEADVVLVAIGVKGNTQGIAAESAKLELFKGRIKADHEYRTNLENVWAVGDCVSLHWPEQMGMGGYRHPDLAHVAHHEAVGLVEQICGLPHEPIDYKQIPGCTYTHPQVASMGYGESRAREEFKEIRVGKFPFSASGRALAAGQSDGFVKLIFDARYGELLGVHMVGENVTELLAELVLARKLEATEDEILAAMHPHPTLSEAVMEAAGVAEGRAIHL